MNKEKFKQNMKEVCLWYNTDLDKLCRKYGYNPRELYKLFSTSLKTLDFLCDLCKDNEIEMNWLLGLDD